MLSKKSSSIVVILLLSLAGCAAPKFPQGRFCTLIWDTDLAHSYALCVMNDNVEDAIQVPAEKLFQEKYVAQDADYFGRILDWADEVKRLIERKMGK